MRLAVALLLTLPILAACGEGDKAAPEASTKPATATPAEVAPVATAAAPANLEAACRDVVNRMYGQEGDAVAFTATGERTAQVSWRAPVDGGRLSFACSVQGSTVSLSRDGQTQTVTLPTSTAGTVEKEAR